MHKEIHCCICDKLFLKKESHNPYPYPDWRYLPSMENYNSELNRCCKDCNDKLVMPMRKDNLARYAFELDRLGRLNTNIDIGNEINMFNLPETPNE